MKSYKCAVLVGLLAMVFELVSIPLNAEILELGASELHGKKDQPEAMTFISRAQVDESFQRVTWRASDKIKQEIDNEIFLLSAYE
jgi:hypothetical protein